jgi:hypothetical protein
MKTESTCHQPSAGVHASACSFFTAPNPADTALVPAFPVPQPSALNSQPSKKPRNGKIARLPKPLREIVNRMLFQHIPYEKIVAALDEIAIRISQQNISNWKTFGGYNEWRRAQEYAIQVRLHQDNLLDLLRRHDASELPELGLQIAATQLSQFFLTPDGTQLLASDPKEYERRLSMLTRISTHLKTLQKYRDDSAKALGYKHNPDHIRHQTDETLQKLSDVFSSTIPASAHESAIPHRNHLPNPTQLFHCVDEQPAENPRLNFEEFVKLLRQQSSPAKAQHENRTPN